MNQHPHCFYLSPGIDAQKMIESALKAAPNSAGVEFHAHPYSEVCPKLFSNTRDTNVCWKTN